MRAIDWAKKRLEDCNGYASRSLTYREDNLWAEEIAALEEIIMKLERLEKIRDIVLCFLDLMNDRDVGIEAVRKALDQ
jgi:hypothetical protein